uniref:Uncharacterized protein n=1 Tax=viral metagenome TaxID=1070528 RepID=A0A6C0KLV4_9ZZZZ
MEFFLPGLIVLLLAAFFTFLILPRLGSTILVAISVVALLLAGWHHYYMFSSEYRLSTWQDAYTGYAPWVVIFVALLFIINYIVLIFRSSNTANSPSIMDNLTNSIANSTTIMPSANTATNPLTAAINNALKSMNSKTNSPILPNLGFRSSNV